MTDISMNIVDGQAFFAHETTVNFTPQQVVLDFKSVTPRIDPRNKQGPTFVLSHNVVLLDPWHAKQVHKILGEALARYEQEYAKIEKTKAVAKAEKKTGKSKPTTAQSDIPIYMG